MDPNTITSEVTHGNYGLEKALKNILLNMGLSFVGNIYVVAASTEPNYDKWYKFNRKYDDGSEMIQPTVAAAYAATTTNRNDVILLSAYNTSNKVTAMLDISKNRIHFVGLDPVNRKIGARSLLSNTGAGAAADVSMVKVSGTGCSFRNISFKNNWTVTQNLSAMLDYGANTYFENCDFENLGSAHLTNASAGSLILAGAESIYVNCTIGVSTLKHTVASAQEMLISKGTSAQAATRCIFKDCRFQAWTSQTTHVFVRVAADGDIDRDIEFDNCRFVNFNPGSQGATMAVAIATPSGLVSGDMTFAYPVIGPQVTNLATSGVGNAGVNVVSPVLAAAASDCVAVQAS